jgi:hypothetical protein
MKLKSCYLAAARPYCDFFKVRGVVNALVVSCYYADHFRPTLSQQPPQIDPLFCTMNNDCAEVDRLILEIADYKNDYSEMAAEKLFRKCSTSWEAYQYLQDRVHDSWLPNSARQQLRQIVKRIQVRLLQRHEYGYAYEES